MSYVEDICWCKLRRLIEFDFDLQMHILVQAEHMNEYIDNINIDL